MGFQKEETHFNKIFGDLTDNLEPPTKRARFYDEPKTIYKEKFYQILQIIIHQIKVNFLDIESLHFFVSLNFEKFQTFAKDFPIQLIGNLCELYDVFDKSKLESQLRAVYNDPSILGDCASLIEATNCMYYSYNFCNICFS